MAMTEPEPPPDPLPASLPELMDAMLGGQPLAPLEESGDACSTFAALFPEAGHGSQLLATYFWWSLWHSLGDNSAGRVFAEVLDRAFGRKLDGKVEPVVVAHAEGTRFSLLLLDPTYGGAPKAVTLQPDGRERFVRVRVRARRQSPDQRWRPRQRVSVAARLVQQAVRHEFGRPVAIQDTAPARARNIRTSMVLRAIDELCRGPEFGVVLLGRPAWVPMTGAPDPATAIYRAHSETPCGTVGYVLDKMPGPMGVSADHVLDRGALVVQGQPMKVISRDALTDTCVVRLTRPVTEFCKGNGPMLDATPQLGGDAHFHGAASNPKATRIDGYGPDVVSARPSAAVRLYTALALALGDSGSALVDGSGNILGIATHQIGARLGTEQTETPLANSWSWAAQVLTIHKLL